MDQIITAAATTTPAPTPVSAPVNNIYASFGRRLGAALLDGLILSVVNFIVSSGVGSINAGQGVAMASMINVVIDFVYYIYCIGSGGQTLGKKVVKIRVTRENGDRVGYGRAILREVIGKPISGLVLMLGYLWAIWDSKKQTWHDKMVGTIVVRV